MPSLRRALLRPPLRSTLLCAPLLLAPLSAAAEPAPKIVNGEAEAGFPAVVSLGADIGSQRYSLCTGSIVTTRIVLTAAHCGDYVPPELVAQVGRAFLGDDIHEAEHELALEDMILHPDYVPLQAGLGGNLPEYDLAVVILAEDAPVDPLPVYLQAVTDDDPGREMLSVGYGASSGAGAGSGVKRSAPLLLDRYDDQFLYTDASDNPGGGNICSGDSGGPQLLQDDNGVWVQWGVHSWGYEGCGGLSASTRTDIASEWLLDQVEAVHGTRDLCAARGWYGDGVCDASCGADPDCEVPPPFSPDDAEPRGGCSASGTLPSGLLGLLGFAGVSPLVRGRKRRPARLRRRPTGR